MIPQVDRDPSNLKPTEPMIGKLGNGGGGGWQPVIRVLARDVLLPFVVYLALHFGGLSNLRSLIAAAIVAVAITVIDSTRRGRPTTLTLIVLLTLVLSIVVALISGNARVTLARDCLISAGLGTAFLVSLTRPRPLLYQLLAPLAAARLDPADRHAGDRLFRSRYDDTPHMRHALRVSTLAWGIVLLTDATLRLVAVLSLSVSAAASAATALTIITVIILIGSLRFYLPGRLRPDSPRRASWTP